MADQDNQDKFNEPGYKKLAKYFESTPGSRPGMYRGNKSSDSSDTAEESGSRPGMYRGQGSSSQPTPTASTSSPSTSSGSSDFSKAFAEARKSGASQFDYQGKKYAAVTKEEVDKSGSKNLAEYLNKNKSTSVASSSKSEPDDYSQLDSSVQKTASSRGVTPPDDYSQSDSSVQNTQVASSDSSNIFSGVKDYVSKTLGLREGGSPFEMDDYHEARMHKELKGTSTEEHMAKESQPFKRGSREDGGDHHIVKGHDYIKDLL